MTDVNSSVVTEETFVRRVKDVPSSVRDILEVHQHAFVRSRVPYEVNGTNGHLPVAKFAEGELMIDFYSLAITLREKLA